MNRKNELVNLRKICGAAQLFLAVLISVIFVNATEVLAAEEDISVSIDNCQPVVGEPIHVSVSGLSDDAELFYIWTIDGELANRQKSTYTPSVDDYEKWIMVRVYDQGEMVGSDRIWFSKLPVVYINTDDGDVITSKTEYKTASMLIQGNPEYGDSDQYGYEGGIQIKGRGNDSWYQAKKPYKIKLDTSTDLFGFGKNKHWVLLANYRDESLVRNTIANEISVQMGLVGMDTTWVDVIMNGEYVGNYQFCEQIRVAEPRVNIFSWDDEVEDIAKAIYKANDDVLTKDDSDAIEELLEVDYTWVLSGKIEYKDVEYTIRDYFDYNTNISGGYLLELTTYTGTKEISEFNTDKGMRVIVDTPEYAVTNDAMMEYIKTYMQDYENATCAIDGYNADNLHYTEMADFDSMVRYWLTLEICGNNDAAYKSRWAYKDVDGLFTFGPVWDFDWGFGTAVVGSVATDWKISKSSLIDNLFKEWIDDPYFLMKAQEQYWKIRPYLQSIVDEGGLLEEYTEYLKEAGAANESLWKGARGFQGDADIVKTYLSERLVWLDQQFASQESIMESLYTEYSASPYTKSDDNLIITMENAAVDNVTLKVPADGLIPQEEELICQVYASDEKTKTIAVYVNGLKLDANKYIYDVVENRCSFTIPAERLTETIGSKNVISLIGKDDSGAVTYTNFVTIVVEDNTNILVSYDYVAGAAGTPLAEGLQAYPATGGVLADGSTVKASINGGSTTELTYSEEVYTDGKMSGVYVPVMAASKSSPWGENAYFEVECQTKGYENVMFSASLGATKKGPRDYKLQYSLDGEVYQDVEKSDRSLTTNKEMQQLYSEFLLPSECENREILYIRIVVASDVMVNGSEGLVGATGGEAAINHISVSNMLVKYTMQFDSNGGSAVKAIRGQVGMLVQAPEDPYREGYTFSGWYQDQELTQKYEFDTMPEGGIILYAKWDIIRCSIIYQDYDGTVIKSEVVDYGGSGSLPENPQREGFIFEGWSDTVSKVTEDITVIAIYVKKPLIPEVTAPTVRDLTYTGEAQGLILEGETTGGVMQYSLDGVSYSADIPTGTDAGSYMVYYKVVGDDDYEDLNVETPVEVVIKKAEQPGNAPSESIHAEDSYTKVGDIPLPEGWGWQDADRETALAGEGTISAVAVYNGDDKVNYEKITLTIAIVYDSDYDDTDTEKEIPTDTEKEIPTGTGKELPKEPVDTAGTEEKVTSGNSSEQAAVSVQSTGNIIVRWSKVKKASYYEIYVAVKGKKYGKAVTTVKASSKKKVTIKTLKGTAIDPDKVYKFKVRAYRTVKGKKKYLANSKNMYVVSKNNKKYTNVSKITIKKKSYKLTKGKTVVIKATVTKQDKSKKLLPKSYGVKLSYTSSNKKVATVTKKGKIKAKGKGVCYIYVQSLNGRMKKIKVNVK